VLIKEVCIPGPNVTQVVEENCGISLSL